MNWSLRSIGYWLLLILSLAGGIFLTGYSLLSWSIQKNSAGSIENVTGLSTGVALLMTFYIYFQNRGIFPLKKTKVSKKEAAPDLKSFAILAPFTSDYPLKIELGTTVDGMSTILECGAPSPIRFRATQINPASQCREEDYERIFYNSKNGEIVQYNKSRSDHRGLYKHFLWIINPARKSVLPKSYMEQYNVVESEPKEEKRAEIRH
jgi:hypothetical protein